MKFANIVWRVATALGLRRYFERESHRRRMFHRMRELDKQLAEIERRKSQEKSNGTG